MYAQVLDLLLYTVDRAEVWLLASALTYNFATNTVFLVGELQRSKSCPVQIGKGAGQRVDAQASNGEAHVLQPEGFRLRRGGRVLPWAEEEEKSNDNHVRHCQYFWSFSQHRNRQELLDDRHRHRFYSVRRRVRLCVQPELPLEAEIWFSRRVESWVLGPQARERLANRA